MARIMLALDGSARAEEGLPQAVQFCGPHDELLLVRVASSFPSSTEGELKVDNYLHSLAARLRKEGLKVFSETRIGQAAKEIVKAAREQQVDLLILCTHGNIWRRLVFGSVSEQVSRQLAAFPVLIK